MRVPVGEGKKTLYINPEILDGHIHSTKKKATQDARWIRLNALGQATVESHPNRKHVHPHMFRHTFVRYARKMGMDYVAIQEIVGHSDISTTMGMYGKPTWSDKVAEAKKMKDFAD